jgi:hypothetical protein
MISFHKLINTLFGTGIVNLCTFWGFGGGGGGGSSTTSTNIPKWLKPYVTYGLDEAQTLYQSQTPQYYPGQTWISPSQQTQSGLQAAQQRALQGNPLLPAAQQQQQDVISGQYLQNNPYFRQALQGGADVVTQQYYDALKGGRSGAVMAGRMGSGAQQNIESRSEQNLANALTNQAGQLAYQNYAAERARQEAASMGAPGLAQSDYMDIQQLMNVGQTAEGYQQAALEGDVAKWNFQQQSPYEKLSSYLGAVYGAPVPMQQTTTQSGGGGKIVCSMMNEIYGFGKFRNSIWLAYSESMPNAKSIEKGYHTIFLPLVNFAKKNGKINKVVRKALEHIARRRTVAIWQEMRGKKRDKLGMFYRKTLEPLAYIVGRIQGVK